MAWSPSFLGQFELLLSPGWQDAQVFVVCKIKTHLGGKWQVEGQAKGFLPSTVGRQPSEPMPGTPDASADKASLSRWNLQTSVPC